MAKEYWDQRYQKANTPWDIGSASPAIIQFADPVKDKNISILIPGCGNAYEATALQDMGFTNINLLDISEVLVNALREKLNTEGRTGMHIMCEDFFAHEGQYDLIIEQTFFCALLPAQRTSYVEKMHSLLKPGGKLMGVLFNRSFESGPPFGGSESEYRKLFTQKFNLKILAPCYNSIPPRMGTELFLWAEKKQFKIDVPQNRVGQPLWQQ